MITLRERRLKGYTEEENVMDNGGHWVEHNTKIKAFLDDPQGSSIVTVQLLQTSFQRGILASNPFVAVGKILPNDSPLFSLVRKGDVEGLQAFIAGGKATLRDRDIDGIPLLDVQMAMMIATGSFEQVHNEKLGRFIECQRLLLLAGADPTFLGRAGTAEIIDGILHEPRFSIIDTILLESSSISLHAYCPTLDYALARDLGGYRGNLWDAALARCGYDINRFREEAVHPRKPRYAPEYTRGYFEQLWEGFESHCPYYHDPPVWSPVTKYSQASGVDGRHCKRERDSEMDVFEFGEGTNMSGRNYTADGTHHSTEQGGPEHEEEVSEFLDNLDEGKDLCSVCGVYLGSEDKF
ncbi:MAG: hypothetical protein Q9165_008321 [Trypethelium subeluteriae]